MTRARRIAELLVSNSQIEILETSGFKELVTQILAIADDRILVNTTQAAQRYSMAPSTLYRWSRAADTSTKPEPALWVGEIPLWDQDELDAYAVEYLGRQA